MHYSFQPPFSLLKIQPDFSTISFLSFHVPRFSGKRSWWSAHTLETSKDKDEPCLLLLLLEGSLETLLLHHRVKGRCCQCSTDLTWYLHATCKPQWETVKSGLKLHGCFQSPVRLYSYNIILYCMSSRIHLRKITKSTWHLHNKLHQCPAFQLAFLSTHLDVSSLFG